MLLEDHFGSGSTVQRNERVKLAASFWINVGAGMVIGGMAAAFFLEHVMHQPERGGMKDEPNLIGSRAVTRHAMRRQLRLVQLDQVLHLPALAIDVLIEVPRRALERGHDVTDVDLLAHAVLSRLQRAFQPSHDLARTSPAAGLVQEARIGAQLRLAAQRMIEAQIDSSVRYQGIERGIAGEAEDVSPPRALLPIPSPPPGRSARRRATRCGSSANGGADAWSHA
jgi:hypothetical protein